MSRIRDWLRRNVTRRLDRVAGMKDEDSAALEGAGIRDQEQLMTAFWDKSLDGMSPATLTRAHLAELLDGALSLTQSRPSSWPRRFAPDVLAALLLVAFVLLLFHERWFPKAPPPAKAVVVARTPISTFAVILATDLEATSEPAGAKLRQMEAPLVGHHAATEIAKGSPVGAAQIMDNVVTVRLPIRSSPTLAGRRLPLAVDLVLSPRDKPDTGAVVAVVLLAFDASVTPPVATVALPEKDAATLARWIGSSEAYLSLHIP